MKFTQVWSNDKYQSVEHRVVVNENKPRMSFPLFFNPSYDTIMAPVPEIVGKGLPLFKEYNYGDFSKRRNDSNYKNMGVENIQISDFVINRHWYGAEIYVEIESKCTSSRRGRVISYRWVETNDASKYCCVVVSYITNLKCTNFSNPTFLQPITFPQNDRNSPS